MATRKPLKATDRRKGKVRNPEGSSVTGSGKRNANGSAKRAK